MGARFALISSVALLVGASAMAEQNLSDADRQHLKLFGDEKQLLAILPAGDGRDWRIFFGDASRLWEVPIIGSSSSADRAEFSIWDPRHRAERSRHSGLAFFDETVTVRCDERSTALGPLSAEARERVLAAARFEKQRWDRRPYALARDDRGTYYFVDKARATGMTDFRVHRGPRGKVAPLKMVNVVSDSEGDVFMTRSGKLRLVLGRGEAAWVEGKQSRTLVTLPLEQNLALIYRELGVYAGASLGTPCDAW
jgi:hypothetical protein